MIYRLQKQRHSVPESPWSNFLPTPPCRRQPGFRWGFAKVSSGIRVKLFELFLTRTVLDWQTVPGTREQTNATRRANEFPESIWPGKHRTEEIYHFTARLIRVICICCYTRLKGKGTRGLHRFFPCSLSSRTHALPRSTNFMAQFV